MALQEFHSDKRPTLMLVYFVNGTDVGMIEGGGGPSLALKTFEDLWILGDALVQKFKRDESAHLHVLGLINHPHPAATEPFQNAIVGNCFADHRMVVMKSSLLERMVW